ncbi:MAG: MFS transporter [Candidatus Neomarinimicrobiota bacterium]|tara:strand:- start:1477 stop:2757 length:1281 start_codon:yes stop_codon:yes gene_type:complete
MIFCLKKRLFTPNRKFYDVVITMSDLKTRFGIMMFLQYAIWGSWTTALGAHLDKLGFAGSEIAAIYGCLWLGCIIAPFVGGQIADRLMPTQLFLGSAHLVGGVLLYFTAIQNEFGPMWTWMFVYCLFYAPTLAVTNSICFRNLENAEVEFGKIRMWGTIGWIAVGWMVTIMRSQWNTQDWAGGSDLLMFAAVMSIIMGAYCLTLPNTPPVASKTNPYAFLEAISLLKDRNFLIFMLASFVVTTELQFYYIPTAPFLLDMGAEEAWLTAIKTVAQIAEVVVLLFLLHVSIQKFGIRLTMVIGILAWPIRYFLFMVPNLSVIVGSLTLHGFGYAFFFVTSQIYVNMKASDDMRASAQAMLTFFTLGVGNYLGTLFTGYIWDTFKLADGTTIWWKFFFVPAVLCTVMAFVFLLFFKDDHKTTEVEPQSV